MGGHILGKVYEIEKSQRKIGAHLFKDNQYDTVLINSVLVYETFLIGGY